MPPRCGIGDAGYNQSESSQARLQTQDDFLNGSKPTRSRCFSSPRRSDQLRGCNNNLSDNQTGPARIRALHVSHLTVRYSPKNGRGDPGRMVVKTSSSHEASTVFHTSVQPIHWSVPHGRLLLAGKDSNLRSPTRYLSREVLLDILLCGEEIILYGRILFFDRKIQYRCTPGHRPSAPAPCRREQTTAASTRRVAPR